MIKYTRSLKKLSDNLEYILQAPGISLDSKAILLVLAATMSNNKYAAFIDSIARINFISFNLKQVNFLRIKYGDLYRDFILAGAMRELSQDVSTAELELFISEEVSPGLDADLSTALDLKSFPRAQLVSTPDMQKAADYLIAKLDLDQHHKEQTILDAYLHCRSTATPEQAFNAVIYAMASILQASGLDPQHSLSYSYKLANHALEQFSDNRILHSYKTMLDANN